MGHRLGPNSEKDGKAPHQRCIPAVEFASLTLRPAGGTVSRRSGTSQIAIRHMPKAKFCSCGS